MKIQPVAIRQGYLTNGGNLLANTPNGWAFVSPKGEIVGYPSDETERDYLLRVCPEVTLSKPIWLRQSRISMPASAWHVITTYRITEDFSRYRWETSSNGGDYGFWTTRTVFARRHGGKIEVGYLDRCRTTADYDFTDDGCFQHETQTVTVWASNVVGGFWFTTAGCCGQPDDERPLEFFEQFTLLEKFDGNLPPAADGLKTPSRREIIAALRQAGMFLSNGWGGRPRRERTRR